MNSGKSRWALPQPRSLAMRLSGIFIAAGLALAVVSAYVTERFFRNHLETSVSAALSHHAKQVALKLSRDRTERVDDLQQLAANELASSSQAGVEVPRDLLEKKREEFRLAWLGVTDASGRVVVASGGHLEGQSVAQASWFTEGRNGPHVGRDLASRELSEVLEEKDTTRFLAISVPVKDASGGVVGVLCAQHYLSFDPQASPLPAGAARDGIFANVYTGEERRWLLSSVGGSGRTPLPAPITTTKLLNWRESFDGVDYLMGFARTGAHRGVQGPVWLVAVRQSATQAYAPAATLRWRILGWGCGLTLLFAIPVAIFARKLGRRLRAVAASAERIRSGETLAVMPLFPGRDELARMSTSLSQMVEELRPREPAPHLPAGGASIPAPDGEPAEYVRPAGKDPRRVAW